MFSPEWPDVRAKVEELMAQSLDVLIKRGLDPVSTEYHRGRHAALSDLLKWHAANDPQARKKEMTVER